MFKKLSVVFLALSLLSFTGTAHAASDELIDGMASKAWHGAVDMLTGWIEFPAQIIKGYNEGFMDNDDLKLVGAIGGIFEGFGHSMGRTFSGMGNLFTFWAANAESNEGIGLPLDAEYAWEEGEPYNVFDPDLIEGAVKPVGKKFIKGAGDALLGFVEVPGQIAKGISDGAPDFGIVKGIYYWFSRTANGFTDMMLSIAPNPRETYGIAFDEEYPWEALTDSLD